jgi:uncharacterized protein YcbK (DUF882 family)
MKLNWRELNRVINDKTENELKDMLMEEFDTLKRVTVLERLHQRFTTLRAQREREELLSGARRKTRLM